MPDETVDILLQIRNDQRELRKMQANFDDVRKSVAKVDEKLKNTFGSGASWMDDFQKQFKTGFNIGTGAFAAEKAIEGVLASVRGLRDFMARGINFDATVEQSQVAFETLLGDSDAAKDRIEDLITFAARTPFRLPGIIDANRQLQVLTDGALAGTEGLRIVGDAAAATGRPFEQVAFWVGRTFAGLKSGTPVGEATLRLIEMGLVSGETAIELQRLAKESRSADEAFQIISDTFAKTENAMERQSRTFAGLKSTVADTLDQMAGKLAQPIFDTLKASMEELLELIGALPTAVELAASQIQNNTASAIESAFKNVDLTQGENGLVKSLDEYAKRAAEISTELGKAGVLGEVELGREASFLEAGFGTSSYSTIDEIRVAKTELASLTEGIELLKTAISSYGNRSFADVLGFEELRTQASEMEEIERRLSALQERIESFSLTPANFYQNGSGEQLTLSAMKALKDQERQLRDQISGLPEIRRKLLLAAPVRASEAGRITDQNEQETRLIDGQKYRKEYLEDEKRITSEFETQKAINDKQVGTLKDRKAKIEEAYELTKAEVARKEELILLTKDDENRAASLASLKTEANTAELRFKREIYKIDEQIAAQEKKATSENFATRVKASDLLLDQIKHEKMLLSLEGLKGSERGKFNELVAEEKRLLADKAALLEEEYQWLLEIGELEKAAAKRAEIQNTLQAADRAGAGNETKTRFQRANDERLTLGDEENSFQTIKEAATAAIWDFEMQAGTVADQIFEHLTSIQEALHGSISNSIAGLIDGTMSFGEAWQNVAQTIGTSVVKAIADMAAQWLVAQAAMRAASLLGIQTEAVASGTAAAASAAAWAPAATASLIATFGASAASSALLAPAAAANAAALGALSAVSKVPGFERGGEPQGRNALIRVNESGQEVVVNNRGYEAFGSSFFEGINAGTITPATLRSETVGSVEGVGAPGINLHVYNDLETAEQYLNSGRGEDHFMKLSDATRDTTQEH